MCKEMPVIPVNKKKIIRKKRRAEDRVARFFSVQHRYQNGKIYVMTT
jgi:phage terminase large subunit-like protein